MEGAILTPVIPNSNPCMTGERKENFILTPIRPSTMTFLNYTSFLEDALLCEAHMSIRTTPFSTAYIIGMTASHQAELAVFTKSIQAISTVSNHYIFLIFNFEIIIDAYAIVRSNTERYCIPFTQFPPMVASLTSTVPNHNQEIDMDTILLLYLDFTSFTCMCVPVSFYAFLSHVQICVAITTVKMSRYRIVPSSIYF